MPLDQWLVDLTPSLFTTAILHVVHNLTGTFKDALIWWELFEYYLTHISRFIKRPFSKARLLQTCFVHPPHSYFRDLYKGFDAAVYSGRWATLLEAVRQLLPLERSLRAAWDLAAYIGHVARWLESPILFRTLSSSTLTNRNT